MLPRPRGAAAVTTFPPSGERRASGTPRDGGALAPFSDAGMVATAGHLVRTQWLRGETVNSGAGRQYRRLGREPLGQGGEFAHETPRSPCLGVGPRGRVRR